MHDWHYICLTTNSNLQPRKPWRIIKIGAENIVPFDEGKTAIKQKILFNELLPGHDINIFVNNHTDICGDLNKFVNENPYDFISLFHTERNCLYEESKICFDKEIDSDKKIINQARQYLMKGFPKHWGLFETSMILRYNTPRNIEICEKWWQQIKHGSKIDSISLPYVLWENSYGIKGINKNEEYKKFFIHHYNENNITNEERPLCIACQNMPAKN